jgi:hypothetical protein
MKALYMVVRLRILLIYPVNYTPWDMFKCVRARESDRWPTGKAETCRYMQEFKKPLENPVNLLSD